MSTHSNFEQNVDQLLREFLISQLPDEIQLVYQIVASLKYPIADNAILDGQVKEHHDPEIAKTVAEFLANALLPSDFPLKGALETLEILTFRLRTFIPQFSTHLIPIGIGLGGGHGDDFNGPGPCLRAVRPFYEYCFNTASGASPEIQRLERLACHGRALGAVIQCNEQLGVNRFIVRFNPCGRRALDRYAECIVNQILSDGDPSVCRGSYKKDIYRCRLPYIY